LSISFSANLVAWFFALRGFPFGLPLCPSLNRVSSFFPEFTVQIDNEILLDEDKKKNIEIVTNGNFYFAQNTGANKCEEKCEKEYNKCLKKGLDLDTFASAPDSIVKRICSDENRIC
jgi:hypothetical protein